MKKAAATNSRYTDENPSYPGRGHIRATVSLCTCQATVENPGLSTSELRYLPNVKPSHPFSLDF